MSDLSAAARHSAMVRLCNAALHSFSFSSFQCLLFNVTPHSIRESPVRDIVYKESSDVLFF